MKDIFRIFVFIVFQAILVQSLIAEPLKPSEYGNIKFIDAEGESHELLGVMAATDSDYFIFEDEKAYITNVKDPKGNLKHVEFYEGQYSSQPEREDLRQDLKWTMGHVRGVMSKNEVGVRAIKDAKNDSSRHWFRQEHFDGCGEVEFYATYHGDKSPQERWGSNFAMDVSIPDRGMISFQRSPSHIEFLRCREDGTILLGALGCETGGRCKQVVNIIDAKTWGDKGTIQEFASYLSEQTEGLFFSKDVKFDVGDVDGDGLLEHVLVQYSGCNANCGMYVIKKIKGTYTVIGEFNGNHIEQTSAPDFIDVPEGSRKTFKGYSYIAVHNNTGDILDGPLVTFYAFDGKNYKEIGVRQEKSGWMRMDLPAPVRP